MARLPAGFSIWMIKSQIAEAGTKMNFLKIALATTISFILGAMLSHAPTAKANPPSHVFIVPVWMADAKTPQPADLPGNRIAGISCIPKPADKSPDAAVCYVATTN
jgi:hypothetical protein